MQKATTQLVRESYDRCCASSGFFDTFYDNFLATDDGIAAKFARTDFRKQKALLKASILIMITIDADDRDAREALERIGKTHAHDGHDIPGWMYDLWLDSLCQTIREHDRQTTPQLEQAWREQLQGGIDLIKSRY